MSQVPCNPAKKMSDQDDFQFDFDDAVDLKETPAELPVKITEHSNRVEFLENLISNTRQGKLYFEDSDLLGNSTLQEQQIDSNGLAKRSDKDMTSTVEDVDYFSNEKFDSSDTFESMNLSRPTMKALASLGYQQPTKIQAAAIPVGLRGKDICGAAVTGSGKTAAFVIPILERLMYRNSKVPQVRVLILLPTRELAVQCMEVVEKLSSFSDIKCVLSVGGLNLKKQELALQTRPDIVVATPGRLIDHLRNAPSFSLDNIEILVLDEADRMLEIGFTEELDEIIRKCPVKRQTMLFSATMTDNVQDLIRLSLKNPVKLFVDSVSSVASNLTQEFVRIRENHEKDREAVILALCKSIFTSKVIIFLPTKQLAHRMRIIFGLSGLRSAELHGNLNQAQRLESLDMFKRGTVDFLLCTDIAARGLDIPQVATVLNFTMPAEFKTYQHRVGRTARAGNPGTACSLCGEVDRKNMKEAIKNSSFPSKQRIISVELLEKYTQMVALMEGDIERILKNEREARELEKAEMECKKAQNIIEHEEEIKARPKRTWFQSDHAKQKHKFKNNV